MEHAFKGKREALNTSSREGSHLRRNVGTSFESSVASSGPSGFLSSFLDRVYSPKFQFVLPIGYVCMFVLILYQYYAVTHIRFHWYFVSYLNSGCFLVHKMFHSMPPKCLKNYSGENSSFDKSCTHTHLLKSMPINSQNGWIVSWARCRCKIRIYNRQHKRILFFTYLLVFFL